MRLESPLDTAYTESIIKNLIERDNNSFITPNSYNVYPRVIEPTERKHCYLRLQKTVNGIMAYYSTPFDSETSNKIKYNPSKRKISRLLKDGYIIYLD